MICVAIKKIPFVSLLEERVGTLESILLNLLEKIVWNTTSRDKIVMFICI